MHERINLSKMAYKLNALVEEYFDDRCGCLEAVVSASSLTIPRELLPFALDCLPGDHAIQAFVPKLFPRIAPEYRHLLDSLVTMRTSGDGDCLLHAVMLSLCGFEDKSNVFRQLLVLAMTSGDLAGKLQALWKAAENSEDEALGFPQAREDAQLLRGYEQCVNEATQPGCYLGPLHVACLSNILCRPIVVYADEFIRDIAGDPFSGQSMRGIYLPVLRRREECHKRCILLVHSASAKGIGGHFTPLIGTRRENSKAFDISELNYKCRMASLNSGTRRAVHSAIESEVFEGSLVPLVDFSGKLLPLKYCYASRDGIDRADVDGATDHQAGPLLFAIQHNLALERTRSASYAVRRATYCIDMGAKAISAFVTRVKDTIAEKEHELRAELLRLADIKRSLLTYELAFTASSTASAGFSNVSRDAWPRSEPFSDTPSFLSSGLSVDPKSVLLGSDNAQSGRVVEETLSTRGMQDAISSSAKSHSNGSIITSNQIDSRNGDPFLRRNGEYSSSLLSPPQQRQVTTSSLYNEKSSPSDIGNSMSALDRSSRLLSVDKDSGSSRVLNRINNPPATSLQSGFESTRPTRNASSSSCRSSSANRALRRPTSSPNNLSSSVHYHNSLKNFDSNYSRWT